jgi:hypothetical protein
LEILAFGEKESWARLNKRLVCFLSRLFESPSIHHLKESSYNKTNATTHQLMEDSWTYTKIVDSNQSQILQTQIFFLKNDIMSNWKVQRSKQHKGRNMTQYLVAPCSISLSPEANIITQKNFLLDFMHWEFQQYRYWPES